jgi:hypothetical protein
MLQCGNVTKLQCCDFAILQDKVTQLSTDFGYLVGEVSPLQSAAICCDLLQSAAICCDLMHLEFSHFWNKFLH